MGESESKDRHRRLRVEILVDVELPDTTDHLDDALIADVIRSCAHRGIRVGVPTWPTRVAQLTTWSVAS